MELFLNCECDHNANAKVTFQVSSSGLNLHQFGVCVRIAEAEVIRGIAGKIN